MSDDLTPEQIRDRVAWLKNQARQGADALHARAAVPERQPKLTNAESAAVARKRIDQEESKP
jgi:hypothetical protein